MKKIVRVICMVLVCSLFFSIPAKAVSMAEARESAFFAAYGTDLYKTSSTSFQICFDVIANAGSSPQVLGVSEITLYRSANGQNWSNIKLYIKESYPSMVAQNTSAHGGYVPYNFATAGYYYRARITFYAKNSTGIGEKDVYTEILRM